MEHLSKAKDLSLRVMVFNVENLFLLFDQELTKENIPDSETEWQKLSSSVYENKPLVKTQQLAALLIENTPDIVLLCEVGGLESLNNFNRLFLNSQYSVALVEGNSDRNIDVGFLIHKRLGIYFDIHSNRNRVINSQGQKFSRDVAELHLFIKDREQPFFIFLLSHLKSHLDPDRTDPMGIERRTAELNTLVDIYLDLEKRFDGKIPIAIGGDFNGHAAKVGTSEEFQSLYQKTQLEDVCDMAGLPDQDRVTFYQISRSNQNRVEGKQLDYCFLNPSLKKNLSPESVKVLRYKNPTKLQLDPPESLEEKLRLPSDHYPLVFDLKNLRCF